MVHSSEKEKIRRYTQANVDYKKGNAKRNICAYKNRWANGFEQLGAKNRTTR